MCCISVSVKLCHPQSNLLNLIFQAILEYTLHEALYDKGKLARPKEVVVDIQVTHDSAVVTVSSPVLC